MYQSRRVGDEAKKRKSPAKSRKVAIAVNVKLASDLLRGTPVHNLFIEIP